MKKIIVFILCAVLLCATPIIVSAEATSDDTVDVNGTVTENLPTEGESATESENSASESMTEEIVEWVRTHIEEISVVITLLLTIFYEVRKHGKLNGSIGTLNNNAIAISENSTAAIKNALSEVMDIADVVKNYKEDFEALLAEVRKNADEKKSLEDTLNTVEMFLKTAKLATLELSNEVAELLVLANIPNSKKEELYARHTKAIHELEAAEEVMNNDNTET